MWAPATYSGAHTCLGGWECEYTPIMPIEQARLAAGKVRRRIHHAVDEAAFAPKLVDGAVYHRSRQLVGEDVVLAVRRFERPEAPSGGPTFVLVHGLGVSSRSFGPTAAELARHGVVYLVDLAGYGDSPRPGHDMTIAEHAASLAVLIRALGLDRPVVVGHSMGSQVVTTLAAEHPDSLASLVVIAPVVWPDARSFWSAVRLLAIDGTREPLIVTLLAINDYLFRAGIPYMVEQTPHLIGAEIEKWIGRVQAPVLVMCGERDPIVPLEWGETIAEKAPDGRFVTVPGPHVAMFTHPDEVSALILGWVRT